MLDSKPSFQLGLRFLQAHKAGRGKRQMRTNSGGGLHKLRRYLILARLKV